MQGIDIIFVGPYDLSQSLELPGQIWHPMVASEIERIVNLCQKNGIETGIFTDTAEGVKYWKNLGVKYINYRIDTEMLFDFAKKCIQELDA